MSTAMATVEIPDERLSQVGLTFRRAANEFHGSIAREPDSPYVEVWRASAEYFDELATALLTRHNRTGLVKFK